MEFTGLTRSFNTCVSFVCLILFMSCSGETKNNDTEEKFNYEELFSDFTDKVQNGEDFESIVERYYFEPNELLASDTAEWSSYMIQDIAYSSYKSQLLKPEDELKYYWDEELKSTPYRTNYDEKCDCNLVVESKKEFFYLTVCFFKGKIYSMNNNGFNR